jgi:hypothetical protein
MNRIIFYLLFLSVLLKAQAPQWDWAKTVYCKAATSSCVGKDNFGNVITAINFGGTVATSGGTTMIHQYNANGTSIILQKLDESGNYLWQKLPSAYGEVWARSLVVNNAGDFYVLGDHRGAYLDTTGLNTFPNNGTDCIFLAKFSAAGNVIWAKSIGGNYYANSVSVTLDANEDPVICGTFDGSYLSLNGITINNLDTINKTACLFVAKYNSAGSPVWAQSIKGNTGQGLRSHIPTCIRCNAVGDIYVSGWTTCTQMVFGTQTVNLVQTPNPNIFLFKLGNSGTFQWARSYGSSDNDEANAVSVDGSGYIYLSGRFESNTLTIGTNTLINPQSNQFGENMFLAKFDGAGNVMWAKSKDRCYGAVSAFDANENLFISGFVRDSVTIAGSKIKGGSMFLAKFDANGNELWGKGVGVSKPAAWNNYIFTKAIVPKVNDEVYIVGLFQVKKVFFDTCTIGHTDTTGNMQAFFLAKTIAGLQGLEELTKESGMSIYPNPADGSTRVIMNGEFDLVIVDPVGKKIVSARMKESDLIDTSQLSNGIYFLRLIRNNNVFSGKLIIQHL